MKTFASLFSVACAVLMAAMIYVSPASAFSDTDAWATSLIDVDIDRALDIQSDVLDIAIIPAETASPPPLARIDRATVAEFDIAPATLTVSANGARAPPQLE